MLWAILFSFVGVAAGDIVAEVLLGLGEDTWQHFAVRLAVYAVVTAPGWYWLFGKRPVGRSKEPTV